mmetsp:Transcript_23916/g.62116  ORF Transcript_23916/g.62116 Transcript_23916/m.62116 type:complete len:408 (+) Transcript_23916:354-1577(+)
MSSAQAHSEHFHFRQPHESQWNSQGDLATVIGLPPPNDLMQLNRPLLTPMLASAFSIPLPDYGGSDGGSFGGQMVQGRMDGFVPGGNGGGWGMPPGLGAGPSSMPYGRPDMHHMPPAHPAYGYPASYQQHEEDASAGYMQQQQQQQQQQPGGYPPMKPPSAGTPQPPGMYGHHHMMPPAQPPHMDAGKGPMAAGMPAYPGHQPGMMGYDPRGDPNMMGMPPHMQGMYGMRPHGYPPGMPPEYGPPGSSKHQLPEGGRPPTPGADWEDEQAQALKRPRLVWTPQLHKRFVDAVEQLGIKNAVPKTIMQLMNVDGLTRENVASHLQKFRLHLKRAGGAEEGEGTHGDSDGWDDGDGRKRREESPQEGNNAGSGSKRWGAEDGGGGSEAGGGEAEEEEAEAPAEKNSAKE